jgi:hypothetical protein
MIPNEFTAKTSFGSFRVRITNRDFISIGGKNDCVQIGYKPNTNTATLHWLGTEKGGCEMTDKVIKGESTTAMTDLGFTILKKLYPDVNPWVTLRDSSTFRCDLPDGNRVPISTMKYNLLMRGKTYYQDRFNAVPQYEEAAPAITLFYNAWATNPLPQSYKPIFDNKDLFEILGPIYENSSTWKEFFEQLYAKYQRHTCVYMHAWYLDVYGSLAKIPITTDWKIDIQTRSDIGFEITDKKNTRNYTRKSYVYDPYNFSGGYYIKYLSYKPEKSIKHPGKSRKMIRSTA